MWVYDIVKNVTIVEKSGIMYLDKNNKDSFYTFAED